MKRIFLTALTIIITISFVGCTGDKNNNITEQNQTTNDINVSEDKSDYADKSDLEATPTGKVESENKADSNIDKPDSEEKSNSESAPTDKSKSENKTDSNTAEPDKTVRIFKITTKNIDYKVISGGEIKTVGLGVADNIRKILSTISTKYFDGKSLELKTIETVNNKKIAVINLGGDKSYWYQKMQGSVGGQITEYTLIENILQKQYKGYWIDGVRFTLNGKQLKEETSHCPNLAETIFR
ncbi:hypothetical protein SH2C18_24980 [Clostridium sediminicola]|uniref:hypothetical protein n=1 Tax=Clostridium sediminicola TaxID=3114879 RepID=UPI0031F1D091